MPTLSHKIDFAIVMHVKNANPNGDPLNGNRPRTNYAGLGEITDVAMKRKLRDRLQEEGNAIFVQAEDRCIDGERSLRDRAESEEHGLGKQAFSGKADPRATVEAACKKWFDVRAFGQIFAFKGEGKKGGDGLSLPIRGPVTVQNAFSVDLVSVESTQITKSVNLETTDGRGSDTMGMKHRVDEGVYVCYGSMNPQLAERTGFSDEDAAALKAILPRLFENDASSARPEGSMEVLKVVWWEHGSKAGQYSSAKVHRSLQVAPDGSIVVSELPGLMPEIIDGF
jgi:CRISPR-associated protein Csd2